MSYYHDTRFLRHLDSINVQFIFEAGARYGDETLELSKKFKDTTFYAFECNPLTIDICRKKLENINNINFIPNGLGDTNEMLPFYSYIQNNDGASSLFKRIDFNETQKQTGVISVKKLSDFVAENNIPHIDLLCMDVQGYELNILKGSGEFIKNIKFIIMEEPKSIINLAYLPPNVHSKYINAPSAQEIKDFMLKNNFIEIERIEENKLEDNVMYKNISF
jgi:FkbM family methyltransferase